VERCHGRKQLRVTSFDGTRVTGEQKLTIGQRVRAVTKGADGGLCILTDEADGALLKIVPDGACG
jgi:glucose/arabinose dehydrogenase